MVDELTPSGGLKMIPESDLLAVKKGLTADLEKKDSDLQEALKKADENYQTLLNERASTEAVKTELEGLRQGKTKADELQTQLDALKQQGEQASNRVLELHRRLLVQEFGISKEVVDGKDQHGLTSLEEALRIVGPKRGSGIDRGSNLGSTDDGLSSREKIAQGLAKKFPNQ